MLVRRRTRALAYSVPFVGALLWGATDVEGQATQSTTRRPDPLQALVVEALARNLGLEQARLREQRAEARFREARGRWLPSIGLDARYSEQEGSLNLGDVVNPAYAALNEMLGAERFPTDVDITLPYRHETRFRLVQPVFDERIRSASARAREEYAAEEALRGVEARAVAADVQMAWYVAAAARDAVAILDSAWQVVNENERVAKRLIEAGRATPDVLHRARAERADVEQQVAEARERALGALRELNRILDRALDTPLDELTDASLVAALPLPTLTDELVATALARREELAQATAGIGAAKAGVRLARASYIPSVALALDYGWQGRDVDFGSNRDFAVASVVLSWALSPGSDAARRRGAQLEARRAEVRRRELVSVLELEIRQAHEAAVVAREAIATAETRERSAERAFELVRRRYEEGLASHVEFVDARTAMTSAQLNRSIAAYRYGMHWVELERAAALRDLETTAEES
jgi:outer membrane protein TolC